MPCLRVSPLLLAGLLCRTVAAFITGPMLQAESKVDLDASYGIGTEPAATTRQVEITFTD